MLTISGFIAASASRTVSDLAAAFLMMVFSTLAETLLIGCDPEANPNPADLSPSAISSFILTSFWAPMKVLPLPI